MATSPIDPAQSVAGEEDPGASLDIAQPAASPAPMRGGDQAPAGTGETVCPSCGGSGLRAGRTCPECEGTGRVTAGTGGA